MASMSVSGIVSGMDWESMIDEIITNAAKPAQPQVNKKTDLTNKKSLFEEMKTMMNSLQSSLSPLKLPSTYKAKTIDIERLDKNSSYKGVLTATANADAEVNIWDVKVNKLATAQINRSKQITGSSLSSTLSGVSGNTMYVNAGGQKIGIEVKSTDTLESLKSRINTTLKTLDSPIYVTASVVDNKLILKSDYTGLGTMTASETTRYNYSSGVNRLSNITIPDAALDSVKVTSGTKSYVIHKDFEVANGNEIRWKQNDRGDSDHLEVGLSGEANINYRMAAGDVYTNKGTYGTDEVEISGFDLVDNGTIASRAKIVDDDGNEYVYGKDFKIVDKKIVWLEAPEVDDSPKYNEPDAYTVSLTKNIPVNITKTYTKGTSTNEPDSYTVSGIGPTPDAVAASGLRGGSTAAGQPYIVSYASGGSVASGSVTTDGTTTTATVNLTVSGGLNYQQLINEISTYEPDATLEIDSGKTKTGSTEHVMMLNYVPGLSLTGLDKNGNQTEFVYGRDYILRDNGSGSGANYGTLAISFRNSDPSGYVNLYRNRGGANVDLSETTYLQPKGSSSFSFSYTPTYSTENGVSEATIIQAAANDGGSVTVTDTSGNPFVEGVDYVVDGGQIKWLDAESDDISFTAEQAAEISALPTITLTDGDNVLRTYVDPEDLSAFTLTDEDGKTYEYGRDYVLRINDTGDGYAVSWLVKSPVDGTAASITNANTVVATYAQYRNISTSSFTSAPLAAKTYSLSFQGDAPEMSEQGSSSLDVTGWTNITVSDGTKTYTEGTDYTVSGGRITWSGTKPSTDDTFSDISLLQSAFLNTTGSSSIPRVTLTDSDGVLRTYLDLDGSEVNFQLADASGNAYTYGRDYVIRVSDDGQNYVISWAVTGDSNNDGTTDVRDFNPVVAAYASEKDINTSNWRTAPTSGKFTFATTSTKTISLSGNVKATDTDKSLAHVLSSSAITSADYGNVTIPGYTQGKDYVINSQGVIRWLNQNSTTPEAYKATYKFSDTASATVSNISASGTSINLYSYGSMPSLANMGVKTFVGDKLNGSTSYNYVDENEGKAAFTLTDSSGNTYEYGKDFAVRCSSLTSTSLQLVMPNNGYWPSSFSNTTRTIPAGETLTLTYNNTATRFVDSEDTLAAGLGFTPSTLSKLTLSDAYGNDYTEDTDYTIDSAGNVTWIDQTTDAPASYKVNYTIGAVNNLTNALEINGLSSTSNFPTFYELRDTYGFAVDDSVVSASGGAYYLDAYSKDKYKFVVADEAGSDYVYGRDYVVRKSGTGTNASPVSTISWRSSDAGSNSSYSRYVARNYPSVDLGGTRKSQPSSYSFSLVHTEESADTASVASLINEASGHYENITLTASNGRTYTYVSNEADLTYSNFTIVDGEIKFKSADTPKHPAEGVGYTFTYDAFSVSTDGTDTYTGASSQEVAIKISDEAGKIGDNKDTVSYEQILSFAKVSSTDQDKIDSALGNLFSLTDSDGNSYTYGTDYRIIKGDTDSDSGESTTKIEWIESTTEKPTRKPAEGKGITLTFTGGETISTTLQRSATDAAFSPSVTLDELDEGTVTITQGMKTFYKGVDFKLAEDDDGNATIEWISDDDGGYEWFYPEAGTSYTVNFTDDDGNTTSYTGRKNSSQNLDMADLGMTTANGSISFQYGDGLQLKLNMPVHYEMDGDTYKLDENGDRIPVANSDGNSVIKETYATDITQDGTVFNFRWLTPTLTSHSNLPSMNDEITVEYEYDANTFDLEDDSDGDLLYALGFVKSDKTTYDDYTEAKNAILDVDGEEVERDSNDIGADYENELIKGVTMHLKGLGEVSLDISHDAEKAVTSIQSFVDNYNDLMSWMNTRMSEKQVDEDTKATIDSDDFRMRWGLLHGNSLLRNTKSQMRSLTSQNFTFSFTQRKSSEEVYGPMSFNGLRTSSTLRLRIGTKYVDVTIDPTDTLETIVKKISDDTKGGAMNDIYYDDNGEKLKTPLLKALVENDKLVIQSSSNDEITMSGSAAMNALKMNYTYKGLYQIGLESTSDDYGKSGELVFDESEFMEALEDNPDEVQALMLKFVGNFDTWIKSMLNSSASGETSGTLTREIENIQTRIDSINEYLENYQERLDRMEESLRTRYANTETQFSKLSQQANSIAAILNQLNGTATGGGYGQTSS